MLVLHQVNLSWPIGRHPTTSEHHPNTFSFTVWWREPSFPVVPLSSGLSKSASMSDLSLPLVLPSEPVEVVEDVESLPDTFGFASGTELLMQNQFTSHLASNPHSAHTSYSPNSDFLNKKLKLYFIVNILNCNAILNNLSHNTTCKLIKLLCWGHRAEELFVLIKMNQNWFHLWNQFYEMKLNINFMENFCPQLSCLMQEYLVSWIFSNFILEIHKQLQRKSTGGKSKRQRKLRSKIASSSEFKIIITSMHTCIQILYIYPVYKYYGKPYKQDLKFTHILLAFFQFVE